MKILQDAIQQYSCGMKGRKFPPCFKNKAQYDFWLEAEAEAGAETKGLRQWACRDCSVSFQKEMVGADRCLIPLIPVEKLLERRAADDFETHLVPWSELESSKEAFQQSLYPSMFDVVMGVVSE